MLIDFIGMLFANTMLVLSIYKLSDKKIDYKNWSVYVCVGLYNILVISGVSSEVHIAKPLYNFICLLIAAFIITKYNFKKSMIICATIYIVSIIIEVVVIAFINAYVKSNHTGNPFKAFDAGTCIRG